MSVGGQPRAERISGWNSQRKGELSVGGEPKAESTLSVRNSQRWGELSVGGQPRAESVVSKEQSTLGRAVSRRTGEAERDFSVRNSQR